MAIFPPLLRHRISIPVLSVVLAMAAFYVAGAAAHRLAIWPFQQGYFLALRQLFESAPEEKGAAPAPPSAVPAPVPAPVPPAAPPAAAPTPAPAPTAARTAPRPKPMVDGLLPVKREIRQSALLQIEVDEFDLGTSEAPGLVKQQGALAALPDGRLLLGDGIGQLYLVRPMERTVIVMRLPLALDVNRERWAAHVRSSGLSSDDRHIRLTDLVTFDGGRQVAASFTYWDDEKKCGVVRVQALYVPEDWTKADNSQWRDLFTSQPCLATKPQRFPLAGHQAGGGLAAAPDGRLYLGLGDFEFDGLDGIAHPQDPAVDYGKVIAIDPATGTARRIAQGVRNPQGLGMDARGRLWAVDHGPRGGDELNLIEEGADYGWPTTTFGIFYGGAGDAYPSGRWPGAERRGQHQGFRQPVFAWAPSIAPNKVIAVRGFADEWNGDILVGALGPGYLYRLRFDGERVVLVEPIRTGRRTRGLVEDGAGSIWIWSDDAILVRLRPAPEAKAELLDRASGSARSALGRCMECHEVLLPGTFNGRISLVGLIGRPVAGATDAEYSAGLRAIAGVWTAERLGAFLENPEKFAPGTSMAAGAIADLTTRRQVVEFLSKLR